MTRPQNWIPRSVLVPALLVLLALVAAPGAALAQSDASHSGVLNDSGISGRTRIAVSGSSVTVEVQTSGNAPGMPHAQHVHIGGQNLCAPASADTDGDGFVSTPEGEAFWGLIQISLTTEGDVSPASALAVDRFPVADADGTVSYLRTFELPDGIVVGDLDTWVVVQHGVADTRLGDDPGAYDGPDSPLMPGVPQEASLPAWCAALPSGQRPQ